MSENVACTPTACAWPYFNSERLLLTRFVFFFFLGISYLYGIAVQADALHSSLDMKLTPLFVASAAINIKPS